jgi:signal transduction histidine kinase
MKNRLLLGLLALLVNAFCVSAKERTPVAVNGVLDLRQYTATENFEIKLNGEWEFYWKKMLHPHDFNHSGTIKPDYFGKVPSYWTDYPKDKVKTEKFGYATYRLTILLPPGLRKPMAFNLPVFDSSYDLYLDGEYITGNGIPGTTAAETKPEYKREFVKFDPSSDTITIILNVSNFDHRRGGFWLPVTFGTYNEIRQHLANSLAGDWATISLLMGFSLFFLFFFTLYPKDKIMAFFSIAVIGLALRPLFTSHFLILNFTNLSWVWIIKFEYLTLFLIMLGWAWFAVNLYPSKLIRYIAWTITSIFLFSSVLTLFSPVRIFSYSTLAYYPSMVILLVYLLYESFIKVLSKSVIDMTYFAAFLLFTYGAIHDVRVSLGKSDSSIGYSLSFIVVAFVFIQAFLLLYKWVKAYYEKEKLHNEVEFMNRNLELLVNERTQELKTRNEEIEAQNSRIAFQNNQLSDTIQLKNKIFSVIAHDLRSPVVNILYMLNLLKEKEYKENYDAYADSCIQYSQSIITLLENMLVWGRGQEGKIKFSPGEHDLAGIILTNLSIFKETADRKEISMNFTQMGRPKGYFDKDLIDIVIRNILTNAIKYTYRGGRISILLKEKPGNDDVIMIKICDNGVGISKEKQVQLFSNIEIKSAPGTEDEKGTGLGLKLCDELIKINNGRIAVESNAGEGTCFSIMLPIDKLI